MTTKPPCDNQDCDLCHPLPRWIISTETLERRVHEREIKAATREEAMRLYDEGTAWPSDYDTRTTEVLEEKPAQIQTYEEAYPDRVEIRRRMRGHDCWNRLEEDMTFTQEQVDALLEPE